MIRWQVKLHHIDFYECPENWFFRRPEMSDYDLLLFKQGGGIWKGPAGEAASTANSCIMLEKGCGYTGKRLSGEQQRYFFIHYDYLDNNGKIIVPDRDIIPAFSSKPDDFNLLYELASRCMMAFRRPGAMDEAEAWLKTILVSLIEQKRLMKGALSENAIRINELCLYVKEHINRKWKLEDMAARVNLSPGHFAVIFKRCMNQSPGDWVINCRVNRAKTLLRYSPKTVSEIADKLGYCDIFAFSKQFKQITGMTPKQYQRSE